MSSFEFNKLFAAVLIAGIVAMLSGFIAKQAVHPEALIRDAVAIEGASAEGGHDGAKAEDKGPEPVLALLETADVERGAKLTKACAACHSFEKGGPAKQGPNLWGVINRDKAGNGGFDYSDGMKEKGGKWDYASLNLFLTKPKNYVAGTKMNFIGLKKVADRAAVIAWLRTLADTPPALPSEAEITAEQGASSAPADETAPPAEAPAEAAPGETPAKKEGAAEAPAEEGAAQNAAAPEAGTESPDPSQDQATPENPAPAAQAEEQKPETAPAAQPEAPQQAPAQ